MHFWSGHGTRGSSQYKYVVFPIPGVFILRRGPGLIGNIGFIYSHPTPTHTKQNKTKTKSSYLPFSTELMIPMLIF